MEGEKMQPNRVFKFAGFVIPGIGDPRWLLFFSTLAFAITLILDPGFGKTFSQLLTAVFVTVGLDFFINFVVKKKRHFPLSAMTTSIGMTLIIFSPHVWPFAVIPVFAALSKYFIKYKGLHLFNPNNCGMVLAFVFLGDYVATTFGRWTESPILFFSIILIGLFVSYRVNRLDMSLAYLVSFAVFALLRTTFEPISISQALLPFQSAIFFIFIFYHMTDPISTPKNRLGRIVFAVMVALIDNGMRFYEIKYSMFYALFVMAAFQPLFEKLFHRDYLREHWNTDFQKTA